MTDVDMSSLSVGFIAQIRKQAVSAQGETIPNSKVLGEKHRKLSFPYEEAQKSSTVITVDSPERAFDALLALEGVV